MKIVWHGEKKRRLWWLNLTLICLKCGCMFMVEEGDLMVHQKSQPEGEWISVVCPECGKAVTRDKEV